MAKKKITLKRFRVPSFEDYMKMTPNEKKIVDEEIKLDFRTFVRRLPPPGDTEARLNIFNALYEYLAPMYLYIGSVASLYQSAKSAQENNQILTPAQTKILRKKKFMIDELPSGWDYSITLKLLKPLGNKVGIRLGRITNQIRTGRFYTQFLNYLLRFSAGMAKNFTKKKMRIEQKNVAFEKIVGGTVITMPIEAEEEEKEFEIGERYDVIKARLEMYVKLGRLTPNERIAMMLLDQGKFEENDPVMSKAEMYQKIGIRRRKDYLELLDRALKRLKPELTPKEQAMYNDFLTLDLDQLGELFRI